MTRITSTGRDWTARPHQANGHAARNFGLPYPFNAKRSEPLSHSIGAVVALAIGIVSLIILWSVA